MNKGSRSANLFRCVKEGFTEEVTFEMSFDEGIEAHQEGKKENSAHKCGNAAVVLQRAVDTNSTCSFGLQTLLKIHPSPQGQGMVQYIQQGASNLLNRNNLLT